MTTAEKKPPKTLANKKKRVTVYLEPVIHQALKQKAAETGEPISAIANQALQASLLVHSQDLLPFHQH